uniref:Uncharacterized protein n=1 Tax=Pyxicephalus adspersus TaxID=30357 RepID=A0AAV3AMH6_PYXAD|nr:TPA: hypothetical protein GDO54_008703 [Pyxicephalus adspersus]
MMHSNDISHSNLDHFLIQLTYYNHPIILYVRYHILFCFVLGWSYGISAHENFPWRWAGSYFYPQQLT